MVEVGAGDILPPRQNTREGLEANTLSPSKNFRFCELRPCQLINKDRTGDSLGEKIFIKENLIIIYYLFI